MEYKWFTILFLIIYFFNSDFWCMSCIRYCVIHETMNLSECVWHHDNCRDFSGTYNIAKLPVNRLNAYTTADQKDCPKGYAKPDPIQNTGEKNNVILVLLDDLDEMVTPYLETMPFLRSLVEKRAVRFENTYSSTSICCAARCQMLTGRYGHNIGVIGKV